MCMRKIDQFTVNAFLAANEMPLEFHENIFAAKSVDQDLHLVSKRLGSARLQRAGKCILHSRTFCAWQTCRSSFRQNAESLSRTGISTLQACAPQKYYQTFRELR